MLLKLKKAFPIIIFAVVTVAIGSVLFEKCGNGVDQKSFLIKMDSLNKVNDSLNNQIAKDDAVIDSLNEFYSNILNSTNYYFYVSSEN
jgi:hypothetical protein